MEGTNNINLGSPLNALSLSPSKTHAFVVGRDVLKIVSIQNNGLRTIHNMRPGKTHMNYTGNDCAWNPLEQSKHLLATAATNGAVVIWNMVRDGQTRQEQILTEHSRAVNRVTWHPENSTILLTGSQDGSMKLWDMREKGVSSKTFQGHSEVRDVQFSPFYPNYFAAGFDNGNVQIWDIRNTSTYKDTLTAHQGLVLTVDWHPEDKNLIATGGRDRIVKVWNLQKNQFIHSIQTISSVARVKWRPGHKFHIATCASLLDFRIHIWDVRKPYLPIAGLVGHRDVATGIIWQHGYALLSCGKDSALISHDTANAERPATTVRTAALSWSVRHELTSANDPIVRADIHDLRPSDIPPPPALFSNKRTGVVSVFSFMSEFKEFGPSFDTTLFTYFAQHYKLLGAPLAELCEHNSMIATEVRQHQVAQVWQLLKLFYDPEFDPVSSINASMENIHVSSSLEQQPQPEQLGDEEGEEEEDGRSLQNFGSQEALFSDPLILDDDRERLTKSNGINFDLHDNFLLNEESVSPLSPLPLRSTNMFRSKTRDRIRLSGSSASESRPHTPTASAPPSPFHSTTMKPLPSLTPSVEMWDHSDVILQLLDHYAERGDVQTCVAICTVLRGKLEVPKDMFLRWATAYIELLQRHNLWTIANFHIKTCNETQISRVNQQSTTIHTGCAHCGKPLFSKGWACEKCKKLIAICSICQEPVKGMYVWCQGCGHGGHLSHLHEWFQVQGQKLCPGGCSHHCTFKPGRM